MKQELCFKEADILIPNVENTDMKKWSVIACDQYTSDLAYWNSIHEFVGGEMSTLNMIFPEVYLETEDEEKKAERIKNINTAMSEYSKKLKCYSDSVFYIERTLKNGSIRHGFVGMIDLEEYDYKKDSKSKIRATEETVVDRLPPRIKIRQNAVLELPHVMLLYNDENNSIVDDIKHNIDKLKKVYDFELMKNSGSIKSYRLDEKNIVALKNKLANLEDSSKSGLLFAVGDGNHSLAAAKEYYENIKRQCKNESINHPARYALVEIVNIYDESLNFEPIYRVLFDIEPEKVIESLQKEYDISFDEPNNKNSKTYHKFDVYYNTQFRSIFINNPKYYLPVKDLQEFLDNYLKSNKAKIDYIHGKDETIDISKKDGNIGFIFETMSKSDLFETIECDGVLPRKTFSMGEAYDKRFYIECKIILN